MTKAFLRCQKYIALPRTANPPSETFTRSCANGENPSIHSK